MLNPLPDPLPHQAPATIHSIVVIFKHLALFQARPWLQIRIAVNEAPISARNGPLAATYQHPIQRTF